MQNLVRNGSSARGKMYLIVQATYPLLPPALV